MVDRRHAAGGHWLDAYPFVRLHQASAFYGVASTMLGHGRIQSADPEQGLRERATAGEAIAYYQQMLDRMIASGRVEFHLGCEYVSATGAMTATGVNAQATVLPSSRRGELGVASTSMVTSMPVQADILGSAGRLQVVGPFIGPAGLAFSTGRFGAEQAATWTETDLAGYDGMSCQALALAGWACEGRTESPIHTHAESVSVLATIDEARRQIAESAQRSLSSRPC